MSVCPSGWVGRAGLFFYGEIFWASVLEAEARAAMFRFRCAVAFGEGVFRSTFLFRYSMLEKTRLRLRVKLVRPGIVYSDIGQGV